MKKTNIIFGNFFSLHKGRKRGFTLVEMVAVILVICILAAVSMPFFKRAIMKSHFNVAVASAKAIVQAQEVYYLSQNEYANTLDHLDLSPVEGENRVNVSIQSDSEASKYQYVKTFHDSAPNVRYVAYLKHSPNFADNIHCEAKKDDETALWLCEEELQGQKLEHGSLDGAEFVTYILQGQATDGTFSQTYIDATEATLTNGDICQTQTAGGCSYSSFTEATCMGDQTGGCSHSSFTEESTCVGNQTSGCQHSDFEDSTCYGNQGGGNAAATVCGHNTYSGSDCHGEEAPNGYVCGRSEYDNNSVCYSNPLGGCGNSSFDNGSTCYARSNTACRQSEFTDSACIVESGGGCGNSTLTNSSCTVESGTGCTNNTLSGSTCIVGEGSNGCYGSSMTFSNGSVCEAHNATSSSNRACGSGSVYDHSTCYNKSGQMNGCGKATYNNGSACHSNENGGCGGNSKFNYGSACYGKASGACGSNTYTEHSVCYAQVSGACNNNTYKTGSYCSGDFCPAGSPRQDGSIRSAVGP